RDDQSVCAQNNIATARDVANNGIFEGFVDPPLRDVSALLLYVESPLVEDACRMFDAARPRQMQMGTVCDMCRTNVGVRACHTYVGVFLDLEIAFAGQNSGQSHPARAADVFTHFVEMQRIRRRVRRIITRGDEIGRIGSDLLFKVVHYGIFLEEWKADRYGVSARLICKSPNDDIIIFKIIQRIFKAIKLDINTVLLVLCKLVALGPEFGECRVRIHEDELCGAGIEQDWATKIDGPFLLPDRH